MARDSGEAVTDRVIDAGGAPLARLRAGDGPVLAIALHAGHALRPDLVEHLALVDDERLREEDPFTAQMAPDAIPLVEALRSRFEVDLNRPRFRCVYQGPHDSWGLHVYSHELPDAVDRVSRAVYDTFYAAIFDEIARALETHERLVVLDLHSYNHRRDGAGAKPADPARNPEINLGTQHIDRVRWAPVVDAFTETMTGAGYQVGENVKFGGGHLAHWLVEQFGDCVCPLAIEFKKTYMDEWSGEPDAAAIARAKDALTASVGRLTAALVDVG
ncbi:MAG TPA: N-formylglutamate amidohydrolase [Coriobacteriia bacterium]|nr:N-formylglutamate amidohydrolase [Coriobacteriia bacterium]